MATTIKLTRGQGYTGKAGERCWVARIIGTDAQFGLAREFVEPSKVEREHFNRARTMIEYTYELEEEGLYEMSSHGDRWIEGVIPQKDGTTKRVRIDDASAKRWVTALDAGASPKEARKARKAPVAEVTHV